MGIRSSIVLVFTVPPPSVDIALPEGYLYAGTRLQVVCNVVLSSAVDVDVFITVSWYNGSESISNSDASDRVSISPHSGRELPLISNLTVDPLIDVDASNNFKCQASVRSNSEFISPSDVGESAVRIPVIQRGEFLVI